MEWAKDFFSGIEYFFKSSKLIFKKNLWHYILYPFLIRIILLAITLIPLIYFSDSLIDFFKELFSLKSIPGQGHFLSWLKKIMESSAPWLSWTITILIALVFLSLITIVNRYLSLPLVSPVLSLLSEAAEEKITGKKYPFHLKQLLKDILRGIIVSFRNLSIQLLLFSAGFLFLIIPMAGSFLYGGYQFFLVISSWYFIGYSLMDYSCERHKLSIGKSSKLIWKNKWKVIGIGFCYWLFNYIPLVGSTIGFSFSSIMGTVGATEAFLKINEEV